MGALIQDLRYVLRALGRQPLYAAVTIAVFAVAISTLSAAALLASWLPARRAALTDPMQALRAE